MDRANRSSKQTGALNAAHGRIPGLVLDLNEIAARTGINVDVTFRKDDDGVECAVSRWSGTAEQFRNTGLFNPSARLPLFEGGELAVTGSRYLGGRIALKDGLFWLTELDPLALKKSVAAPGIELLDFGKEGTGWYGTREAFLRAGILTEDLFPSGGGKLPRHERRYRPKYYSLDPQDREWSVRAFPRGKFLYWVQSAYSRLEDIRIDKDYARQQHAKDPQYVGKELAQHERRFGKLNAAAKAGRVEVVDGFSRFREAMQGELLRLATDPEQLDAAIREANALYIGRKQPPALGSA